MRSRSHIALLAGFFASLALYVLLFFWDVSLDLSELRAVLLLSFSAVPAFCLQLWLCRLEHVRWARWLPLCALLTATALALSYLENLFPLSLAIPIPGVKLGLGNIVTVFALYALGPGQALMILTARCLLGAMFAGNMNALLFSLLGGLAAMLAMILLVRLGRCSVYGVSVGGAAAHNCGQMAAAVLTLGSTAPLYYLPVLLAVSLLTGTLTGLVSACLFQALGHTNLRHLIKE